MDDKIIKLKPCPFCGKDVAEITSAYGLEECKNCESDDCPCNLNEDAEACGYLTVVCNYLKGGCGATGAWKTNPEEAVEAWNRRAE